MVGIPYKFGKQEITGCDCVGIVNLYYKNKLNIHIKEFNNLRTKSKARKKI